LDLSQPWTARHQRGQYGLRAVVRAVVDVDELEIDVLGEGRRDLVDERRDVVGFVAYRHDHGNSRRGGAFQRFAHDLPGAAADLHLAASASYGATSCPATLLMRANDGPGHGRTTPSAPITKASRRAAYQSRTTSAPSAPATAPTMTSLGKCAVSTTRLMAMSTA